MNVLIKLITRIGIRDEVGNFTSMVRHQFKALVYQYENELFNYGAQITYQKRTELISDWFDKHNAPPPFHSSEKISNCKITGRDYIAERIHRTTNNKIS